MVTPSFTSDMSTHPCMGDTHTHIIEKLQTCLNECRCVHVRYIYYTHCNLALLRVCVDASVRIPGLILWTRWQRKTPDLKASIRWDLLRQTHVETSTRMSGQTTWLWPHTRATIYIHSFSPFVAPAPMTPFCMGQWAKGLPRHWYSSYRHQRQLIQIGSCV